MGLTILDCYAGCGGFTYGFSLDPNNKLLAIEIKEVPSISWGMNYPQGECFNEDILTFDFSVIGKIDILIGSPPCQDHSIANKFHTHNLTHIHKFLEIRDLLKPKYWIMENVKDVAFLTENGKRLFEPNEIHFLNAFDFSLPHKRMRLFAGYYPPPIKSEFHVPYDVLVPTPIALVRGYYHGQDSKKRIIAQYRKYYSYLESLGIVHDLDYRNANYNQLVNPEIYARIMGFPETYKFYYQKKMEIYQQIGNAVCPVISQAIAESISLNRPIVNQTSLLNYVG